MSNGCLKEWKNDKVFHYIDIAQIISEIVVFQENNFLTQERACSSSKSMKKIPIPWQVLAKIFVSWDISYDIGRMETNAGLSSYE